MRPRHHQRTFEKCGRDPFPGDGPCYAAPGDTSTCSPEHNRGQDSDDGLARAGPSSRCRPDSRPSRSQEHGAPSAPHAISSAFSVRRQITRLPPRCGLPLPRLPDRAHEPLRVDRRGKERGEVGRLRPPASHRRERPSHRSPELRPRRAASPHRQGRAHRRRPRWHRKSPPSTGGTPPTRLRLPPPGRPARSGPPAGGLVSRPTPRPAESRVPADPRERRTRHDKRGRTRGHSSHQHPVEKDPRDSPPARSAASTSLSCR
jgi:hypothetical protein